MKDWLTIIIVLLIIGIVLDGLRRMRQAKRESISLSKNAQKADMEEEINVSTSEFPSGGARVAGYRDNEDASTLNESVKKSFESGRMTAGAPQRIPEQVSLNLDESVPMLMDTVDDVDQEIVENVENIEEDHREPVLGSLEDMQENSVPEPELTTEESSASSSRSNARSKPDTSRQESSPESHEYTEPEEVLIMNVMAKSGSRFAGNDLLQAFMSLGLKYGNMEIFHRHKDNDGDGPIVFSLANMVVPGTFNLANIEGFETPGVTLFLSLPAEVESLQAYDDLARTARGLAEALDGELKDENRSIMTSQTIEHGRQRVIEYERKKKLSKV